MGDTRKMTRLQARLESLRDKLVDNEIRRQEIAASVRAVAQEIATSHLASLGMYEFSSFVYQFSDGDSVSRLPWCLGLNPEHVARIEGEEIMICFHSRLADGRSFAKHPDQAVPLSHFLVNVRPLRPEEEARPKRRKKKPKVVPAINGQAPTTNPV